ncbi:efflux RND transporter permease subunit [Cohnella hashimotonis]|uniref:Efflux RND transporter permease subunit n=1 Tax=Cohnella hashimotonis TaxID=2826895 RepID=A0ABT6TNZ3_9BACL|nr:efflux RND transporter permease subunit [Cohnella hashimotonis]MDI4648540.1 efflux RND transporter permease subunit [Cohnella hashimotonis]
MRSIIGFSLKNKFAVWMITIIVLVAGLYSGLNMKQESLPNLSFPYLSVTTVMPGAAPQGVIEQVTEPLEQRLQNVENVKNVTSTSMSNVSNITLEFDFGQNMDRAMSDVREAIAATTLPEGAQTPTISKFSINTFPVMSLSASGEGSLEDLTKIVSDVVQPALEDISGVASVQISGQSVKEVKLAFDQAKLAQYGMTEASVEQIVQANAVEVPLGIFTMGKSEKSILVDGGVVTLDDLKNLAIPAVPASAGPGATGAGAAGAGQGGQGGGAAGGTGANGAAGGAGAAAAGIPTVKLSELATVELVSESESVSRTNGKDSIGIQIVKSNDANTVDVVNAVKDKAEQIKADHPDLSLTTLLDQGKPIEKSVETMLSKALFGALFAVIIILLFLRNIRTTLISILSIPLSLIIGVLLLKQFDITLNIMTLGAMTVAIGRVVDDSIVVIENIYRRMSLTGEKLRGKELVLEATREMFMPIMSSTIVTIAVFLPLGTVSGMVGQLFLPFALTIVFALLASLLVAITVVPMLAHSLFKNGVKPGKGHDHEDKPGKMALGYRRILSAALRHKVITVVISLVVLVASLFLIPVIGASFLPAEEEKYTMITYSPEPGALLSDVETRALKVEEALLKDSDITNMQYSIGGSNPLSPGPSKGGLFYLQFKNETKHFADKKEKLVTDLQTLVPEGTWSEMDFSGGVGGSTFSMSIYGDDLNAVGTAANQVADLMKQDSNFKKVDTSLSKTYEQYTLAANQQKLSQYGLTAGQVAMALMPQQQSQALARIQEEGKKYDVFVEKETATYGGIEDIGNVKLQSPLGVQVPIKDVVDVKEGTAPNSIARENGRLVATVSAEITASNVAKVSSDLQDKVDELKLPEGVEVSYGGVTEQINETFTQLGLAMAAAIAIVYLVLVLTFGGGLAPFAIMFSLPFAIIGGLVALWLTGETLSVSALMGALMLIGIVVTNAIVLIDRVIHKENEGLSTREALLEAAGTRLRPILMTALATIGALLPLAFGFESAGIISKGLGVTVIGGLVSSTLLTLLIVPIAYETLMKLRAKLSRKSKAGSF